MLVVHSDGMALHDPGPGHPDSPDRLRAAVDALKDLPGLQWSESREATQTELERVHHPAYVARLAELRGRVCTLDPDTHLSAGSVAAAYLAAGAAIQATEAVFVAGNNLALALVRPPGHHAEADAAMGFCLFNNIAIAAEHARATLGCERVLILDWDVHHGNGTQHLFEERRDVLFMSIHESQLYPDTGALHETGRGEGRGYTINVPCPAGRGDADYVYILRSLLVPIAAAFRPNLVLVSAGFDAHRADPLANMELTEDGYAEMTKIVHEIADRYANGRVVFFLEGGYDLEAMPRSLRACIEALMPVKDEPASVVRLPTPAARSIVAAVKDQHADHWSFA